MSSRLSFVKGRRGGGGFTLIELLVVVAVTVILITMAARGFSTVVDSTRLEQAGRFLVDEINLARQTAASGNHKVEVRFFRRVRTEGGGTDPIFWAFQAGKRNEDGEFVPFRAETKLPPGIALSATEEASSILGRNGVGNEVRLIIRPNGMLEPFSDLGLQRDWFVTVLSERDLNKAIANVDNFITIQVDPITARTSVYQP